MNEDIRVSWPDWQRNHTKRNHGDNAYRKTKWCSTCECYA